MSDRDELAALMKDRLREVYMTATASNYTAAFVMDDDPLNDVVVDGHVDFIDLADAILARWRLVPVMHRNPLIDDILRAKATVDAAPAYRCDCVTCRNELIVTCYICGRQDGANPCRTCEPA